MDFAGVLLEAWRMTESPYYLELLNSEFERRKSSRQHYSLRQYATDLGIQAPTLSNVLRGLRPFPWRKAKHVAQKLQMPENDFQRFITSIHKDVSLVDLNAAAIVPSKTLNLFAYSRIIENWEYFAILNYFTVQEFDQDPKVMALRFSLSEERISDAIKLLMECGLLKSENGRISRTTAFVNTSEDVRSETLQNAHRQEMQFIQEKIKNLDPLLRDISSITFSGSSQKIKQAKRLIRNFRQKLSHLMEGERQDNV